MKKRLLSILLMCCMVLTLLPTAVFAEGEEPSGCVCTAACTAEAQNLECPTCGAEDAALEDCAKYEAKQENEPNDTQEPADPQEKAQEESKATEPAEEPTAPAKSQVAVQAAANNKAAAVQAAHTHCFCGGSISAGDHTNHSGVTYQAWDGASAIRYTNNKAYVYLTGNATMNNDFVVDGKTLYLCLNGKTLSSNGEKKIKVGIVYTVMLYGEIVFRCDIPCLVGIRSLRRAVGICRRTHDRILFKAVRYRASFFAVPVKRDADGIVEQRAEKREFAAVNVEFPRLALDRAERIFLCPEPGDRFFAGIGGTFYIKHIIKAFLNNYLSGTLYRPPQSTRHFIAGPPRPTGIGCFLPQKPELDHSIVSPTISTLLSISNATPEIVVSNIARPSLPCLISYPMQTPNICRYKNCTNVKPQRPTVHTVKSRKFRPFNGVVRESASAMPPSPSAIHTFTGVMDKNKFTV